MSRSHAAKLNFCISQHLHRRINQTVQTRIRSVVKVQLVINVIKFKVAKMLKFLIIIVLFYFIMWLQVTHCDEIELDAEFSEFLSKFPFNLGQVFAEFKKNETYYRTQVFYGSECFLDIQRIFLGMTARKLWAFKGKTTTQGGMCILE